MRPLLLAAALLAVIGACVNPNPVKVTFGADAQGLDGFLCKDKDNQMLLDRLRPAYGDAGVSGPDAGVARASLVTDFVTVSGLQSCRTSELIDWCKTHPCAPRSRRPWSTSS